MRRHKCQGHEIPDVEPEHVCAESLTKTDAVAATCVADGCAEYYTCSCGKIYSDAEAKNETTVEDSVIKALVHDEIAHEGKDPTCTENGYNAYATCSRCDYTTYSEISATGHNYESVVTAPTCEEKGYTTYTCSCGDSYVSDEVEALGHTYGEWSIAAAPTYETEGMLSKTCGACPELPS